MGLKFSNFAKSLVGSAPSGTTGLNFTVEAGKGLLFPLLGAGDYFYGIFKDASGNREIVKVTARSTDTMTIDVGGRGLDGTSARTWAAGDYFVLGFTNIAIQESLANANLQALGALSSAPDTMPYFTGSGTAAVTSISTVARNLLDDTTAAAMRATLGVPTSNDVIPSGKRMLFFEPTAPTGWTQITSYNDRAIRIVSGTGTGVAGTYAFSTIFASRAVAGTNSATTLTVAQIPNHQHTGVVYASGGQNIGSASPPLVNANSSTDGTGGGGSHTHTFTGTAIDMRVQYIDLIMASKN